MDGISAASAIASLVLLGGKITVEAHGFFGRIKECPARVACITADLRSITSMLTRLEVALEDGRANSVVNGKRKEFEAVIEGLTNAFKELETLMKKYGGAEDGRGRGLAGWWKKGKWASVGLEEATQLGRLLAAHKQTLGITLQLAQNETLASIESGVEDNGEKMRILMRQIEALRVGGMGVRDPRLENWLESVVDYAGSTLADEDASMAQETWSPRSSTADFTDGREDSEHQGQNRATTIDVAVAGSVEADDKLHLPTVLFRCTQYLRHVTPNKWEHSPFGTNVLQKTSKPPVFHDKTVDDFTFNVDQISATIELLLRKLRPYSNRKVKQLDLGPITQKLSDFLVAIKAMEERALARLHKGKRPHEVFYFLNEVEPCKLQLKVLEGLIDKNISPVRSLPEDQVSEVSKSLDQLNSRLDYYYGNWTRFFKVADHLSTSHLTPKAALNTEGLKTMTVTELRNILESPGGDIDLLTIDWSEYSPSSANVVSDLFMLYLQEHQPIIPPDVQGHLHSSNFGHHNPLYFGPVTIRRGQCSDEEYLVLFDILKSLHEMSRRARDQEQGVEVLAEVFYEVLGVEKRQASILISEYEEIMPDKLWQDGEGNCFSFDERPVEDKMSRPLSPVSDMSEEEDGRMRVPSFRLGRSASGLLLQEEGNGERKVAELPA